MAELLERSENGKVNQVLPLVVRTYFSEIVSDDGDNIEALCSLCMPKKKSIRGQHKAPSNFTKHIQVGRIMRNERFILFNNF